MPAPKRTDANHRAIVQALRQVYAHVIDIHTVPGALDLLVAFRGNLYLLECKDGDKPWWDRALTKAEEETIKQLALVGVEAHVVLSVEDALRAVGAIV